jgi:hypothetical protein
MNCLDNIVGVRGCGNENSSLVYLNELTGINLPDFDKAVNVEMKSASAALNSIVQFAARQVVQRLSTYLQGRYQLKSFIQNDTVGYYYNNKAIMPAQPGLLTGYEIRIDNTPCLSFFMAGLRLFCNHTGTVPVKVFDLLQGKLLDTINVNAIAGEIVSVEGLAKEYPTHRQRLHLFIGYESVFEAYNTSWASPYTGSDSCNTCAGSYQNSHVYFRAAQIATGSPFTQSYLSGNTTSGGAGLSFDYSLQCSYTEYLCNIRNLLAMPILYKAGELVMKEMKHSKRLTGVVTVYTKSHDELMMEYAAEHELQMRLLLQNAVLPESVCFSCNPKVQTKTVLP